MSPETRLVPLTSIEEKSRSQLRVEIFDWYTQRLADHLADAADPVHLMPPVVLFVNPQVGRHFVGAGYYRLYAHQRAGLLEINAYVVDCEDPDFESFRYALGENAREKHGRIYTDNDLRNAFRRLRELTDDPKKRRLSELAKAMGVPMAWVNRHRRSLYEIRKGKVNKDRQKRALEVLADPENNPLGSSVTLAELAGVSHTYICTNRKQLIAALEAAGRPIGGQEVRDEAARVLRECFPEV